MTVDPGLAAACAQEGLAAVASLPAGIGTTIHPPVEDSVDVVAAADGPALIVGHSGAFVLLSNDEALDLADALFDAVMTARRMAANPDARAEEHARQMIEGLGLRWPA